MFYPVLNFCRRKTRSGVILQAKARRRKGWQERRRGTKIPLHYSSLTRFSRSPHPREQHLGRRRLSALWRNRALPLGILVGSRHGRERCARDVCVWRGAGDASLKEMQDKRSTCIRGVHGIFLCGRKSGHACIRAQMRVGQKRRAELKVTLGRPLQNLHAAAETNGRRSDANRERSGVLVTARATYYPRQLSWW